MIEESYELESKDLSSCATNEEINKVLTYIELYFKEDEFSGAQLENAKRLSAYLNKNNIVIGELESETLLDKSRKLNYMFRKLSDESLLVRINNYSSMVTLLDIYCQKNNVELTSDLDIELYNRDSNNDLDLFKLYLTEIGQYKRLTIEEERSLAIKSKNGDINARNKLVEHNLRLVIPIAKRYQGLGLSLYDLVLCGNEGITLASKKFDPSRNCRFSTYATWWIKQSIQKGIRETGRTIAIPAHIHENIVRVKRVINQYMYENNGDYPSDTYLAEALNLSVEKIRTIKRNMEPIVSLSIPIGDEAKDGTLADMIVDETSIIEDTIDSMDLTEIATNLLNSKKLTDKERDIVKMRLGYYGEEMTLEEIGKIYNLSRERIRQIEKVALKKLLKASRALKLETYKKRNTMSLAKTK